ncbi:MAG TPA: nucleotide pyrophosphohydrolase [Pseudonocardiaceae bacterium]|nr:nucleotide pyrophosphohydrolase [Pseudonocardiaceae bacterium]
MTAHDSIASLMTLVRQFAVDRGWRKFHTPRNLATALVVEAAELLELFQWDSEALSTELLARRRSEMEGEIADIMIYLLHLSDVSGVDIEDAVRRKMQVNNDRWPVESSMYEHWQTRARS